MKTSEHHDGIEDLGVALEIDLAIFVNHNIPHQHVSSRDTHTLEDAVPIILSRKPKLRSNVSHLNSWKSSVSLDFSNRDEESLDTHFLSIHNELSIDDTVCPSLSKFTWPEFGCRILWCINDKLVSLFVEDGLCLEPLKYLIRLVSPTYPNIGAVAKLSLTVISNDLALGNQGKPLLDLLIVTEISDGQLEHRMMQYRRCLFTAI